MNKTEFKISKMDCSSEEQMIRMKLEGIDSIAQLDFNIQQRMLTVLHHGSKDVFESKLYELKLDAKHIRTTEAENELLNDTADKQRKILWWVLAINFGFFVIEMLYGFLSKSMGLVADSLDMLADSIVYGLSLIAVGTAISRKKSIAGISGYFQMSLALIGLIEVIRRFIGYESVPVFQTMIVVSVLALIANSVSLCLIQKAKSREAHMQASAIFTSNDIIINIGVIVAGVLVYYTQSIYPDLVIGLIIFLIVLRGAFRILKLSK